MLALLVADLRHMLAAWDASPLRLLLSTAVRSPLYPALGVVVRYRVGQAAYKHRLLRPLAQRLKVKSVRRAGAEIHPRADFGPGFALVHSVGIVVGHEVRGGRDVVLYQGVTLGHLGPGRRTGQPRLGDRVRIGAGAVVLGPVLVGDDATVGAGAVVLADVPAGAVVGGLWRG